MKKLLMVAYHYPPEGGGSGVLRSLKFSKYLPLNGWTPHVLTLNESFYTVKDKRLLSDIPREVTIHRTFALDSGRHLAIRGRYLSLYAVPDRFVSWLPFGMVRGLQVVRNEGIRVLFSTSPPPTAHLIAASIKSITGLPWVADFRDPWIEEGLHPRPGTIRYRAETALEKLVLGRADCVIATTPYLRKEFLSRHPQLPPEKIRVIYNGYDEKDFHAIGDLSRSNRFEIIHAGLVTPEFRDPYPLLKAVADLISDGNLPRDEIQVTFLGGGSYVASQNFAADVKRIGLTDVVEIKARVSHQESLQCLGRAALLLILQASDDTRTLIPAKAFEYLRVGRPILALTLEGATADLLKGLDYCYVVDPVDQASLRHAVLSTYGLWRESANWKQVNRPIWQYERSALTKELSSLLEELVHRTPDPHN